MDTEHQDTVHAARNSLDKLVVHNNAQLAVTERPAPRRDAQLVAILGRVRRQVIRRQRLVLTSFHHDSLDAHLPWTVIMTLEQYWESHEPYHTTPRTEIEHPRALWFIRQCGELAAAVQHLPHDVHTTISPTSIRAVFTPELEFPVLVLTGLEPADGGASPALDAQDVSAAAGRDYIAPEVYSGEIVRGQGGLARARAEVWSLGCVFLDFVEWLTPTMSSEHVPRRVLTRRDEELPPLVEGREAWRDWRRSRVGGGDGSGAARVAAFYFDASQDEPEPSEWIDTYFSDARDENPLCTPLICDLLEVIEKDMMQVDAYERAHIRIVHGKLRLMHQSCEDSQTGHEYAAQPM